MRFGFDETCLAHDPGPRHPETADRLKAIRRALDSTHGVRYRAPPPASAETVGSVHHPDYVTSIERLCAEGGGQLDSDTIASDCSWDAALASAGLAVWAATTARSPAEASDIPFALGRPPGHHALSDTAMGFCIFNNVAVAAQTALDEGVADAIAIIDWDVHHGNGTQDIFEEREDVAYVSIHEEGLYPGTGSVDEVGTGAGEGATLNVPLLPGAGTAAYHRTMGDVITPWVRRHDSDLVLVSAGFDAHRHDPISRMSVTTEGFGLLTEGILALASACDAHVGFVLEGGYGLDTLAAGVSMVHEVCGGYEPSPASGELRDVDRDRIEEVRGRHGLGS